MTPTEAALRAALEEAIRWADESENDPCEICGVKRERCECWLGLARKALAAPPHGKDAGECYSMSAGEADQRMGESKAVRKALGFDPDSIHVAPVDLSDAISALQARLTKAEGLLQRLIDYEEDPIELMHQCRAFLGEGGKP